MHRPAGYARSTPSMRWKIIHASRCNACNRAVGVDAGASSHPRRPDNRARRRLALKPDDAKSRRPRGPRGWRRRQAPRRTRGTVTRPPDFTANRPKPVAAHRKNPRVRVRRIRLPSCCRDPPPRGVFRAAAAAAAAGEESARSAIGVTTDALAPSKNEDTREIDVLEDGP